MSARAAFDRRARRWSRNFANGVGSREGARHGLARGTSDEALEAGQAVEVVDGVDGATLKVKRV
jgi:hypothetical protein